MMICQMNISTDGRQTEMGDLFVRALRDKKSQENMKVEYNTSVAYALDVKNSSSRPCYLFFNVGIAAMCLFI